MSNQPPPPDGDVKAAVGWYPDPLGSSNLRYWDGAGWTTDIPTGDRTPSSGGWWSRNWRYVAFTVAGFVVGGVIGASGNSGTTTETITNTRREVTTRTVPKLRTVTDTVTDKGLPAKPAASSESSSSGGAVQTFSGNGGKNLGNIDVSADSTLTWTNDGDIIQIYANEYDVLVNSQGHSGNTFLPAGTYSSMETNAVGNWTIKIAPK